ncbi:hypothetical protein GCM10020331_076940 [Ectobacillus funiculus]
MYHSKLAATFLNTGGLISNLPEKAVVEVPCLVDRSGITPTYVGELPEQLAALNRTNINTQLLTIEAAITGKKSIFTTRQCLTRMRQPNYLWMILFHYATI